MMFVMKRMRSGEIKLDLEVNIFPPLLWIFSKLDQLFSRKIFYLLPTGVGLGFGLGIVIFSQPARLQAESAQAQVELLPQEVILPAQQSHLFLTQQAKFTLIPSSFNADQIAFTNWTNAQRQMAIASRDFDLSQIKLGDQIQIVASNHGRYSYTVYHLKFMPSQEINQLKNESAAKLVMMEPQNWLGTTVQVALAK